MTEMTMEALAKQLDAQNAQIEALKSMTTTDNAPKSSQVVYTPDLKSKVFEKAPYYRFLESKGRVLDADSSYVAFYIEEDGSATSFIDETDDVPEAQASSYTEEFEKMKTLIHPIDVSLMAQMGNKTFDIMAREIEKGFIKIANTMDTTLLQGAGTAAAKDFKGLTKQIPNANKVDLSTADDGILTEEAIEDLLDTLIDGNGATIDCIVTTHAVGKILKKLVAPYRRWNDKQDIGLGHRVISYESISGAEVPILIDSNLATDSILLVDSSTIEVRRLLAPTVFQNLPTQKLGVRNAVVSFATAQNIASFRDGMITGIDVEASMEAIKMVPEVTVNAGSS